MPLEVAYAQSPSVVPYIETWPLVVEDLQRLSLEVCEGASSAVVPTEQPWLLVVDLQRMPLDVVVVLVDRPSHSHRKPLDVVVALVDRPSH